MHDNGCQGVLTECHSDGMWYRGVGTWLHYGGVYGIDIPDLAA